MIAFGSGDPTKIICSALIAQAFDAVRYPILPRSPARPHARPGARSCISAIPRLYMPRDFDISPYFEVVKPTIVHGFDYTALHWADKQKPAPGVAGEFAVFQQVESPTLVPETIDEEAPLPVAEVTATETIMVERVTVSEHYLAVEYVPVARRNAAPVTRQVAGDSGVSHEPQSIKTFPPASAAPRVALRDECDDRRRRRSVRPPIATISSPRKPCSAMSLRNTFSFENRASLLTGPKIRDPK